MGGVSGREKCEREVGGRSGREKWEGEVGGRSGREKWEGDGERSTRSVSLKIKKLK